MLQCVGYFSMVARTLEIQLDLAELWLQAESFVLPGRCLGLRGLPSPWHAALTRHQKQPPRGCLQPFGAQQPCRPADGPPASEQSSALARAMQLPGVGNGLGPRWGASRRLSDLGAGFTSCSGQWFRSRARGGRAARSRKGGSVSIRFCRSLRVTFLSVHAELRLSAVASK